MHVADASPIIFLAKIKKLELLQKICKEVILPKEVYDEICGKESEEIPYIRSINLKIIQPKKALCLGLGKGEEVSIALALEKKAVLIIDDHQARAIATSFGLKTIGTLGILLAMLKKGLLNKEQFKKAIHELIKNNFRITIELYDAVLEKAEEITKE